MSSYSTIPKLCFVISCGHTIQARGLCSAHYKRMRRGQSLMPPLMANVTTEERFFRHVNKTDTCWLWTGYLNSKGYASFRVGGVQHPAHRVSHELFNGPISMGLEIDHLCRVRHCVNPDHLEAVTHRENIHRGIYPVQTHCINGHEFTEDNTGRTANKKGPYRYCRICKNAQWREWNARRKEKQNGTRRSSNV